MIDLILLDSFVVICLYFTVVILPYLYFYKRKHSLFETHNIVSVDPSANSLRLGLLNSIPSFIVIFLLICLLNLLLVQEVLVINTGANTLFLSIIMIIFCILLHDAYFYWTHYLMHKVEFFKKIHLDHHKEVIPSPLASLHFHFIEAIIHFVFFFGLFFIFPIGKLEVFIVLSFMFVCNSAGHLPLEFYPKNLYKFPITKTFNAATHHILHHKNANKNFGLYYMWWDKWMGTIHSKYYSVYDEIHKKRS